MKAKPYSDYLLCKPIPQEKIGAFLIPETAKEKIRQATVVEVGPGNGDYTMESKPGYLIMHNDARAIKLTVDGEEMIIIREQDCFLRLEAE